MENWTIYKNGKFGKGNIDLYIPKCKKAKFAKAKYINYLHNNKKAFALIQRNNDATSNLFPIFL